MYKRQVSHRGDRFCFTVSEKASEYVHNNMKENEFIKALIELVGRHGCTIEEIKELFHSYSDKIITEPMDNAVSYTHLDVYKRQR